MLTIARGARYHPVFVGNSSDLGVTPRIARATRAIQGAVYYTDSQVPYWTSEESDKVTAIVAMSTKGRAKYAIASGVEGAAALCAWVDKPLANVADPKRVILLTGAAMMDQPYPNMPKADEQER
jgi:hypothetical protein